MKMPKKSLKRAPGLVAGGIAAKLVKNLTRKMLEKASPGLAKYAAAGPVIVGLVLAESPKMENIGMGMIAVGGADTAGTFVPALAGLEDMDLSGVFGDDEMADEIMNDEVSDEVSDNVVNGYMDEME